jgi:putative MATE family efflux protein
MPSAMSEPPAAPSVVLAQRLIEGPIHSTLFLLALPTLLEQFLTFFVGFYDTYLSGEISAAATSAVGLASYVGWLAAMIFRLVGIGGSALVARLWGAGDLAEAVRTTNRALALASVMGLFISAGLFAAAPLFADLLGLNAAAREISIHFLRIDALSYVFYGSMLVGAALLRATGDTRTPMLILAVVSLVNVVASYCLVYGIGPLPPMGVRGIVTGTLIAKLAGSALMLAGYARGFRGLKLDFSEWMLWDATVRRIVRIGLPAAVDGAFAWCGMFAFLMIVSRVGAVGERDAVFAAHVVGVRIEALTYLPADAWGFAAAAMIGQALGAGDPGRARRAGHAAVLQCGLLGAAMSLLYFFAAEPIFSVMHGDPLVVRTGVPAFRLLALFQVPLVVATVYVHGLRGAGDTRYPLLINLLGVFGVRLPLAYLCGIMLHGGLIGAWVGMWADLSVRAMLAAARFIRGRWVRTAV